MVIDGVGTDEELCRNRGIRGALTHQLRDLGLLRSEFMLGVSPPPPHLLTRGKQLVTSPLGETFSPHRQKHLMSDAKLLTGIQAVALTTQPFSIQKVRSS